jgi:hypothetical protein
VKWRKEKATNWPKAFTGLNYLNSIPLSARVSVDEWQYGLLGPYWILSDNML